MRGRRRRRASRQLLHNCTNRLLKSVYSLVLTSFIKHGTGTALPDDNGRTHLQPSVVPTLRVGRSTPVRLQHASPNMPQAAARFQR